MKNYRFHTVTTMKHYNCDKWWIDRNIVPDMSISADSVKEALNIYREKCDNHCIEISVSALKRKSAMYRDSKDGTTRQVGYVITAKTGFEDRHYNITWRYEYIELWVEITEQVEIDFEAA